MIITSAKKKKWQYLLLTSCLLLDSQSVFAERVKMPKAIEPLEIDEKNVLRDLDIPSVRDRNPDPTAGPRLAVTEFRLEGIEEFPELGITREKISQIVEDIRFEIMDEGEVLDSGFTIDELEGLSKLLVTIDDDLGEENIGPIEVQRLIWYVREQMQNRGVTLGMIESVADRITTFYRERGFILAKAYIPEQQVRDGIVTLTLLVGKLGATTVNDNQLYNKNIIMNVFDEMVNQPVTSQIIEEKLYLVNDYPGLSVQGFFEAGKEVGNTKLNINVRNEERFFANFRLDNHGTDETGQNRIYSDFLWNNPTGTADQLHLGALATFSPANTLYGQIRYNSHIIDPRLNFSLGYANNAFILGEGESEAIDALDLEGETYIKDVAFTYKALRSRKKNYSWLVGFESIESEIRLKALPNDGGGLLDDEVENITLGLNFEILQETSKMLHQGNIRVKQGEFLRGAEIGQDENYTVFQADYSLLSFWTLPFTENIETRSTIRLQLQYSDSALSSINQFSTGGPLRARGFESQEFSGDQGAYLGIDWFLNLPEFMNMEVGYTDLKNIIYPFLFVDSAYGRLLSLTDGSEPDISTLVNAGFGFQFAYDNQLSGKLQVAFPIENKFESSLGVSNDDDDDSIFLFEIQYTL